MFRANRSPAAAAAVFLLGVVAVWCTLTIGSGAALRCYVCNATSTATCGDPFSASNLPMVNCSGSCYKQRTVAEASGLLAGASSTSYERGCEPLPQTTGCADVSINLLIAKATVTHCYCGMEACNGAIRVTTPVAIALPAAAALLSCFASFFAAEL